MARTGLTKRYLKFLVLIGVVLLGIAASLMFNWRAATTLSQFKGIDVTEQVNATFKLMDTAGTVRTPDDFRGKPLVVYFGFLNCPDACPTFLSTMKTVKSALGHAGERFNVALITVDPGRDTAKAMREYLDAFDPAFVGLLPAPGDLSPLLGQFRAFAQANAPNAAGYYTVDHTTYSYVFDKDARLRLIMPHDIPVDGWVNDLRLLI